MTELRVESEWLWVLQVYDLCVTIKDTHNSSFSISMMARPRTNTQRHKTKRKTFPSSRLIAFEVFSLSLDGFWCNDMKIAVVIARWDGCFEGGNRNLVLKATKNVFWAVSKCNIVWFGRGVVTTHNYLRVCELILHLSHDTLRYTLERERSLVAEDWTCLMNIKCDECSSPLWRNVFWLFNCVDKNVTRIFSVSNSNKK